MSYKIINIESIEEFKTRVTPHLLENEAMNNLPLGLLENLVKDIHYYTDEKPVSILIMKGEKVQGMALQTPPYNMILTRCDHEAHLALINYFDEKNIRINGILSEKDNALSFSKYYCDKFNLNADVVMNERIYHLAKVIPPREVPGKMRYADSKDLSFLKEWARAFAVDAGLPSHAIANTEKMVCARVKENNLVLWEDETVRSMAAIVGNTTNGKRLGYVYTPHEYRGRGYASSLVANISQRILDQGSQFCFLFTDLKNPTSNSIYKKIGYVEVCDINVVDYQ